MGDKGKRDKGGREPQKKAQLSPKEKRRLKKEKKNKYLPHGVGGLLLLALLGLKEGGVGFVSWD